MNRFMIALLALLPVLTFQNCTDDGKGLMEAMDQASCETGNCQEGPTNLELSITSGTTLGTIKITDLPAGSTSLTVEGNCRVPSNSRTLIEWKFTDTGTVLKRKRARGCEVGRFSFDADLSDVSITPNKFKLEVSLFAVDVFDNMIGSARSVDMLVDAKGTSGPGGPGGGGPTPTPMPKVDRLDPDKFLTPGEGLLSADGNADRKSVV